MRLLVINGANLSVLGKRDKTIYGAETYKDLVKKVSKHAKELNIKVSFYVSNHEGKIVDYLNKNYNKFDGIIINPGAFTHYSYAIRDALEICSVPIVEVHISDVLNREDFRKISVLEDIRSFRVMNEGLNGYLHAMDFLKEKLNENCKG